MFNTEITVGGKTYTKKDATLRDYTALMDYNEKFQGENFLGNKDAFLGAVQIIADWFGLGVSDIEEGNSLQEIFDLYKQIESNISEVFLGMPLKEAVTKLTKTKLAK